MPAYSEHQQAAASIIARCAVVTLSDTRTLQTDTGGMLIRQLLAEAGHAVTASHLLPDEPGALQSLLGQLLAREDVDVVLTTGGTGIGRRDSTVEVVQRLLVRPLDGFGELFRMLSWQQVGSGAMLSRAVAGMAGERADKLIFTMPGSPKAVELAMNQLIVPELKHLLRELRK